MSEQDQSWRRYRDAWGDRGHEFLQADGRWQKCMRAPYCRECIKEREERLAARRAVDRARRSKQK